jgi:hypothetical protein
MLQLTHTIRQCTCEKTWGYYFHWNLVLVDGPANVLVSLKDDSLNSSFNTFLIDGYSPKDKVTKTDRCVFRMGDFKNKTKSELFKKLLQESERETKEYPKAENYK